MKIGIVLGLLGVLMGSARVAHAQFGGARGMARGGQNTQELTVPIDVVFLVDGSGSMTGYLEQTKGLIQSLARNWKIPQGNIKTDLRVGLIQYGNGDETYNVVPMTRDSERLLAQMQEMQADIGGSELVGRVIQLAQQKMDWRDGDVFRTIYVLGNETTDQGEVSFRDSTTQALNSGIAVNAVQCEYVDIDAEDEEGPNFAHSRSAWGGTETWLEMAKLGHGDYFHYRFNSNADFDGAKQAAYSRQFDQFRKDELKERRIDEWINARMGVGLALLRATYIPQTNENSLARVGYRMMSKINRSLGGAPPFGVANNTLEKSLKEAFSGQYDSDLVGLSLKNGFNFNALSDADFPMEMRIMSWPERQSYLAELGSQRQQILSQLAGLQQQRLYLKTH